jgi:RNA polymerase sigma-70 factor, ECF subfamily
MDRSEPPFVQLLIEAQPTIEAYVRAVVPDASRARDVVQETNLVIWRKADEFVEGTNFLGWCVRIAYFEVIRYRRSLAREKLLFDDDVVNLLADRNLELIDQIHYKKEALGECIHQLSAEQRYLL